MRIAVNPYINENHWYMKGDVLIVPPNLYEKAKYLLNYPTQTMIDDDVLSKPSFRLESDDDFDTTKARFTWTDSFRGTRWFLPRKRSTKRMNLRSKILTLEAEVASLKTSQGFHQARLETVEKREEALAHAMIEHAFHFDANIHYNPEQKLFICQKDFTTREVADAYIKEHLPQGLINALYYRPIIVYGWEHPHAPTILLSNGKELT